MIAAVPFLKMENCILNTMKSARKKSCKTIKEKFSTPNIWECDIQVNGQAGNHQEITQNFIDAILTSQKLIAPAQEGIRSVELGNAMLYSSLLGRTVDLPMKSADFEGQLKKLISESKFVKKTKVVKQSKMDGSF
jgi:hypothetical protein